MGRLARRRFLGLTAAAVAGTACGAISFGSVGDRARLAISPGNQTLWRFLEARNKELLAAKGHSVEFVNVQDEDQLRAGLVDDRFQAIATLVPAVADLVERGVAARFFLPIGWLSEGYPLVVPDGSPITTVDDLRGKRVATFPLDHPGFLYWRVFLSKHHGLRGEQIATVQTLATQDALAAGQVDAAFVSGSAWITLRAAGGFRKVADLQSEFRWLTGDDRLCVFAGFIAKSSWLDAHRQLVSDLIGAVRLGLEQYKSNRDAFLDVVTSESSWATLSRDENAQIATYLGMDGVTPDRAALSQADVEDFRRFFPLMTDAGILKTPPRDAGALFWVPS